MENYVYAKKELEYAINHISSVLTVLEKIVKETCSIASKDKMQKIIVKYYGKSDLETVLYLKGAYEEIRPALVKVRKKNKLSIVPDLYSQKGVYAFGRGLTGSIKIDEALFGKIGRMDGVLVHEGGHLIGLFSRIALDDHAYGEENSIELAHTSPEKALKNCDNYRCLYEAVVARETD